MNVPIDYDDNVEKANTHPLLLPKPADKQPYVRTNPTIDQPKSANCRRSVLRRTKRKQMVGPLQLDPSFDKTRNNKVPVTNPRRVSWADRVRGNITRIRQPHKTTRNKYFGRIGNYATRLNIL